MQRIRVAILRGGPSNEYEVSLNTGSTVLKNIPEDAYEPQDIYISREGIWHRNGLPSDIPSILAHTDVVFNALHGHYGEDGKVQHILEIHKIPFTGSGSFSSALAMNKVMTKEIYKKNGIRTPQYAILDDKSSVSEEKLLSLFKIFPLPMVIKPVSSGSSVGVYVVKDFNSFSDAVRQAFNHDSSVMIEEYIKGTESTVGVIDNFRDENIYALPPIEIRPKSHFFDYSSKYEEGGSEEIVPATFSYEIKAELERMAKEMHKSLDLKHYSRSDFIITPRGKIYALETNTLPGLTETSLVPKALKAVGSSLSHFIDHLLKLALAKK